MKLWARAGAIAAGTLLVACGSPPMSRMPAHGPSVFYPFVNYNAAPLRDAKPVPELTAFPRNGPRLYVADSFTNFSSVLVYSYFRRTQLAKFDGYFYNPVSFCLDAKQNVYVNDFSLYLITEYPYGNVHPMKSLADLTGNPLACSVDPTTGDLAVTNFVDFGSGTGEILIYRHAGGLPVHYADPAISYYWFAAYDSRGNLFVDGIPDVCPSSVIGPGPICPVRISELRKGHNTFTHLHLDHFIGYPGGLQWDGPYLAVGDQGTNEVYRFKISGTRATAVGTTSLSGTMDVFQFWITDFGSRFGRRIVGADIGDGHFNYSAVDFWKYPQGGTPLERISDLRGQLGGVAVSLARQQSH